MTIDKTIEIRASADRVFRALTDPAQIVEVYPYDSAEVDPREGGLLLLRGIADGRTFTDHGTIEIFEPGLRFRYRYWSDNHGTERAPENELRIDYRLAQHPGSITLRVEHSNIRSPEYGEIMHEAWDGLLAGLKTHVERA